MRIFCMVKYCNRLQHLALLSLFARWLINSHHCGNRCFWLSFHQRQPLFFRCSIICGGRVASPGDLLHQLQLYRTHSPGWKWGSSAHQVATSSILEQQEGQGLLLYSISSERAAVCMWNRAQSRKFPPPPTPPSRSIMRTNDPIIYGFQPLANKLNHQSCHRDEEKLGTGAKEVTPKHVFTKDTQRSSSLQILHLQLGVRIWRHSEEWLP